MRAIHGLAISHERIYRHVIDDHARGGALYTHLARRRRRHHRIGNPRRRHSIPDRRPILHVSDTEVRHAMNRLNDRPRRILGYRTPAEVFFAPSG